MPAEELVQPRRWRYWLTTGRPSTTPRENSIQTTRETLAERIVASIVRRRGQGAFRRRLLDAYRGRCALTSCQVTEVLEAAHISPYRGVETNHPTNGLLLRSDVHVLFDLGLISIEPETRRVVAAPGLSGTVYGKLGGQRVAEPSHKALSPSPAALAEHLQWSQLRSQGE